MKTNDGQPNQGPRSYTLGASAFVLALIAFLAFIAAPGATSTVCSNPLPFIILVALVAGFGLSYMGGTAAARGDIPGTRMAVTLGGGAAMFVITAFLANWLVGERCVAPNLSCALPSADRKYCLRCESAAQLTRGLSGDDIAQLTCAGMPPDRSVAVRFSAHMLVDDAPDTRRQAGVQLSVDATQDGSKSLTADRVLVDGQLESSMSLAVSAKVPASGAAAGVVIASTKLSRCIFAKDQNPAVPGHCSTSPPGRIEIEVK